jgi:hypothetical protein
MPRSSAKSSREPDVEYVLAVILLLALVAAVVLRPLLLGVGDDRGESANREDLEAAKEAKYREIRDAQLDLEMGKLSKEDHRAVDRELRAEAIELLKRLDALEGKAPDA